MQRQSPRQHAHAMRATGRAEWARVSVSSEWILPKHACLLLPDAQEAANMRRKRVESSRGVSPYPSFLSLGAIQRGARNNAAARLRPKASRSNWRAWEWLENITRNPVKVDASLNFILQLFARRVVNCLICCSGCRNTSSGFSPKRNIHRPAAPVRPGEKRKTQPGLKVG